MVNLFGLRKVVATHQEADRATFKLVLWTFLAIIFALPYMQERAEKLQDGSKWIEPFFDVRLQDGEVFVDYRVEAKRAVRASFKIQLRDEDDTVRGTYESLNHWTYSPNLKVKKPWDWDTWAETDNEGSLPPPIPPSKVCLRYSGYTVRHKTPFDTPWKCAVFTDPPTLN